MPVTKEQARALAQLAVDCRPTGARKWDIQGVYAAIGKVKDRHLADVVLAVIRAADDRSADTPGVINSPGSLHWRERGTDRPAQALNRFDPAKCCGICSQPEHICRAHAYSQHEFVPHVRVVQAAVPSDDKRGPATFTCATCGIGGFTGAGPVCQLCTTKATTTQRANEKQAETEEKA